MDFDFIPKSRSRLCQIGSCPVCGLVSTGPTPVSLSVPVPLSLHVPLSVDRHAVCPTDSRRSAICICKSVYVCVCVCVKWPNVCTIHLSVLPAMNNIPCLFNVNLAQLSVLERHCKCLRLPGYIHHKLSPDLSVLVSTASLSPSSLIPSVYLSAQHSSFLFIISPKK